MKNEDIESSLIFPSTRIGNKLYTLDGKIEVFDNHYKKQSSISLLTEEELRFLLSDYLQIKSVINKIKGLLNF